MIESKDCFYIVIKSIQHAETEFPQDFNFWTATVLIYINGLSGNLVLNPNLFADDTSLSVVRDKDLFKRWFEQDKWLGF